MKRSDRVFWILISVTLVFSLVSIGFAVLSVYFSVQSIRYSNVAADSTVSPESKTKP